MNNQKSLLLNFDDDRFSNKSQFRSKILVKHPADRAKSRPLSAKKNAEPEILEKKVENLEKKQVLWKERNQVWDKQKKNYEKALQNACKDPNEYYKNLMLNWQMSQSKIRTGDVITGKIFELRGFLGWIEEQPGETPLKYIKVLAKEQVLNLDEIENQYFTQNQMLLNEKNSIIEQLQQENHQLTEKMAEGLQDVISSLQEKLNHALGEVIRVTDTSRFFKEENQQLLHSISQLNYTLEVKEQESIEYKSSHMVLENQLQDIRRQLDEKQYISIFPIQEIAETSEKALEKLIVQVKDLEEENVKLSKINEIFQFEIKNLQQAKIVAEKGKAPHLKFNDLFNTKVVSTQTIEFDKEKGEWVQLSCCMASALEDLLMSNIKFAY